MQQNGYGNKVSRQFILFKTSTIAMILPVDKGGPLQKYILCHNLAAKLLQSIPLAAKPQSLAAQTQQLATKLWQSSCKVAAKQLQHSDSRKVAAKLLQLCSYFAASQLEWPNDMLSENSNFVTYSFGANWKDKL